MIYCLMIRKIFSPKVIDRVQISVTDPQLAKELYQAKGVMNNYLRDKHFSVQITNSRLISDAVDIRVISDSRKSAATNYGIPAKSETPLLRRIYRNLESFAHDKVINKK